VNPGNTNSSDVATVKLASNGSIQWSHRFDGTRFPSTPSSDRAVASGLDRFDNLFSVVNANEGTGNDIATLRFAANEAPQSPPVSVNAPSSLSASVSNGGISLRWIDNSNNETGFSVERCIGKNCTGFVPYASLGANSTTFVDTAVTRRTAYRYRVRATAGAVVSAYSNVVSATASK